MNIWIAFTFLLLWIILLWIFTGKSFYEYILRSPTLGRYFRVKFLSNLQNYQKKKKNLSNFLNLCLFIQDWRYIKLSSTVSQLVKRGNKTYSVVNMTSQPLPYKHWGMCHMTDLNFSVLIYNSVLVIGFHSIILQDVIYLFN